MSANPILSREQIQLIASRYDGKAATIDTLVKEIGAPRHQVLNAIRESGGKSPRRTWTPEDDQYLIDNYGRVPVSELCATLQCSELSIQNRKRRLRISTRDFVDMTVRDIEAATRIDHRHWQHFMEIGWLKYWEQPRRNTSPAQRVKLEDLQAFFAAHPEVFNYRAAGKKLQESLGLKDLPEPPKYKLVTCRSNNWTSREVNACSPGPYGRGNREKVKTQYNYTMDSCDKIGGVDLWVPTYEKDITCPRCGCKVSRFSEKTQYSNEAPDEGHLLNVIAGKLGLTYADGRFHDEKGNPLSDQELLRNVFGTRRNPSDALSTFRKLLSAGITVTPPNPVQKDRMLPNILNYELFEGEQQNAFEAFLKHGNLGVYWPPGEGKMFFLGMVMTRLAGRHVIFANTSTLVEQWIAHFQAHAPSVKVRRLWKPYHHEVTIFDHEGNVRCMIELHTYATGADFSAKGYVVAGYDEAHFLPGDNAHRLAFISCEFRIGLTATPLREDGRADVIQILTGHAVGEDWSQFFETGTLQKVPVHVIVVEDLEQKFLVLPKVVRDRKTLVFVEMLEDGAKVAEVLRAPFVSSVTKMRLSVINAHKVSVASRVADCGIDLPDLEDVVEFGFHRGSRAQSLQRLGRLLHSNKPLRHTVMMTRYEFSRYHKRLSALEAKGFEITISVHEHVTGSVSEPKPLAGNPWLQILAPGSENVVAKPVGTSRRYVDGKRVSDRRRAA